MSSSDIITLLIYVEKILLNDLKCQIQFIISQISIMQTHLERPTDVLHFSQTQLQIESLFDAAFLIHNNQFQQSIKHFQDILNEIPQKKYDTFRLEISYNIILAQLFSARQYIVNLDKLTQKGTNMLEALLNQIDKQQSQFFQSEDEEEWPYAQNLRIRIFTTLLQLSVRSQAIDLQKYLDKIIVKLKDYPEYLPEVLGKLCGCKNLKRFCENFNSDHIVNHEQKTQAQKAGLIDLASSWFILGGNPKKGIQCKKLAIKLWSNANSLNQFKKCERQLMQVNSNPNSEFSMKLQKIAKITGVLLKQVQFPPNNQVQQKQISIIVRNGLNKNLQKFDSFNEKLDKIQEETNKANMKKSFWSSAKKSSSPKKSLLKDSKLEHYQQKCVEFYNQIYLKEKNEEITSLVALNSKYVGEQKKLVSKLLVPLIQQYTKRRRYAFLQIKNYYLIKFGMLNPKFLNSLSLTSNSPQNNKDK